MKKSLMRFIMAAALLLALAGSYAENSPATNGLISIKNAELTQVLNVYKALSGMELVIDSRVGLQHPSINVEENGQKEKALKSLEQALIKQARVVITRLDDKRASVTFNDALKVEK